MKALPYLAVCVATFVYLIPMQIALAQAVQNGYRGLGVVLAQLSFTLLFWISILVSWCSLFAQGRFAWLAGARSAQFAVMFGSWLSLALVTALSIGLRGDPQVPTALRPLMPWAVYVLPAVVLASTWALLLPRLSSVPQVVMAGRYGLGLCAGVALIAAGGIAAEYTVLRKREMDRVQRQDPAAREAAIRRAVRDVESLDPRRDLARLLVHAGRDRFDAPRKLAIQKLQSHPSLAAALAGALNSGRPHAALEYLEDNTRRD